MKDWVFLSKNLQDSYINMMAGAVGAVPVDTATFDYDHSDGPIVLRGILKHKIMTRCWQDRRDFYYVDTGYFDHWLCFNQARSKKLYHRVVRNNLQHQHIQPRPADRWEKLAIKLPKRRHGSRVVLAVPDEKPCKFYGIDRDQWITQTMATLKSHTDRPILLRDRSAVRQDRVCLDPLPRVLEQDVHALVTFNSVAAIESILSGVPAFVLAPAHAAAPVANRDLSQIDDPYWADQDKLHAWACSLAYQQWHVRELADGSALRNEYHAY